MNREQNPDIAPPSLSNINRYSAEVIRNWRIIEEAGQNQNVTINYDRIEQLAKNNRFREFYVPPWDDPDVFYKDSRAFVRQILLGNTLNFAFSHMSQPDTEYIVRRVDNVPLDDAYGMFSKIKAHPRFHDGPSDPREIKRALSSVDRVRAFFHGEHEDIRSPSDIKEKVKYYIPHERLRVENVADFAEGLNGQDPADLLKEATVYDKVDKPVGLRAYTEGDQKGLVDILIDRFPVAYGADVQHLSFEDGPFEGQTFRFPFHKRSQLAALMLHGRALTAPNPEAGLLPVVDIRKMISIPDYILPMVQRADGILNYSPDLAAKVDSWEEILKDSPMEVETRGACVVVNFEKIQMTNKWMLPIGRKEYTVAENDSSEWYRKFSHHGTRHHLTKTPAY